MGSVPCLTNWCRASIGSTLAFGLACIFTWCCLVLPTTSTRRKQVFNLDIDVWLRLSRRSQHLKTLPALKFVKEKERRLLHSTMCSVQRTHASTYCCSKHLFIYYTYLILMGNGWVGPDPALCPTQGCFMGTWTWSLPFWKGHWSKYEIFRFIWYLFFSSRINSLNLLCVMIIFFMVFLKT